MAADVPLELVIRFSASNADLILTISNPSTTTALSLKQQIRSHLDAPASGSRLRLIHAGKVLPDAQALRQILQEAGKSEKAAGKQAVRDGPTRVYIHCSIAHPLTQSELSDESKAAREADAALFSESQGPALTADQNATTTTTTPAPRGFDRLLSAGFTQSEIAALRTQFLAIQAHTHTPDTMPSGADLLALEERWLDNTANPGSAGAEDTGPFGGEDAGGLEDMLWGNLIGFFWPVGAMFWLMREDGVWSRRRQTAVLSGFLVNLLFGLARVMF